MKSLSPKWKLMLLALALVTLKLSSYAQSASNNYITAQYIGNNTVQVINHQPCAVDIEIDAPGILTIEPNTKGSTRFTTVPPGASVVKFTGAVNYARIKVLTVCKPMGGPNDWISFDCLPIVTPVKFTTISSMKVGEGPNHPAGIFVRYSIENQVNVSHYIIRVSRDGGETWFDRHVYAPPSPNVVQGTYGAVIQP